MRDPLEGLAADGTIRTGAHRSRVPAAFEPVLRAAADAVGADVSVYVYGSVATGQARIGESDVDLLTIGLPSGAAVEVGERLSARYVDRCRGVEFAAASVADFDGDGDVAYGGRVFLHHYCVHVAGPQRDVASRGFPGDARAARGFNGDIGQHAARWRAEVDQSDAGTLARRIARKSLLAVAGLVSVHDATWTTDRVHAARGWSEIDPRRAEGLDRLLRWLTAEPRSTTDDVVLILDDVVDPIVDRFGADIGLWSES